jgi:uncharacterized SAM-binding protein YcdF (DUF218 family)
MFTGRRTTKRYVVAALILAALICGVLAFRGAGRWLIREDPLSHADVILVLSGSMPYRAEEAAKVFREGYATEIWLTHPQSPAEKLESMGIHYESDEEYDRAVLVRSGVPDAAIHLLPQRILNTEQELEEAHRQMAQAGKSSILIVTSLEHTRRVRTLWRVLVGANPKAIVHGAPEDPFDADHWWRNTRDSLYVSREYFGLLNAWAGLPVRPHTL